MIARAPIRRSAFSLIEMLIVISIIIVLFGVVTVPLTRMLGASGGGREHLAQSQALARLAESFRGDVAAAGKATPSSEPVDAAAPAKQGLTLELTAGRVAVYRILDDGTIERTVGENGETREHEKFALAPYHGVRFEIEGTVAPTMLRLVLEKRFDSKAGGPAPPARPLAVEALLARDRRLIREEAVP